MTLANDPEQKLQPGASDETLGGQKKPPEKTAEDLAATIKEYESKLGSQGQELGELKKRLAYMEEEQRRRDYELAARKTIPEHREELPPTEEIDEFDYTRPGKSVAEITRKELAKELEKRERTRREYDVRMYQEYAKKNYETGWRKAREKNPALFEGIETDVQDLLYQTFAGGKLGADELADDRVWERTAQLLWLERGKPEKIITKERIDPMRPAGSGNLPEQVKPGLKKEGVYSFDEKSKEIMKGFNLTEEEAKKIIDTERERKGT